MNAFLCRAKIKEMLDDLMLGEGEEGASMRAHAAGRHEEIAAVLSAASAVSRKWAEKGASL